VESAEPDPLEASDEVFSFPVSFAQQRLRFLDQLEPHNSTYNIYTSLSLRGRLDVEALESALNEVVRRHESLRTTFSSLDGEPRQLVRPRLRLPLPVIDLSTHEDAQERARLLARAEARAPFDLAEGPLLRAKLLRLGAGEHVLVVALHHIVSDGWSMGVFSRELSALYDAYSAGRGSPLGESPI
jgi:NRPS condensation-like uncharacterized protein